jgi:NAD(P)H dehydrogenase (quinone)
MHAHIVLAHPEPQSFNGALAAVARRSLERLGWSVSVSDLYVMGFDPCERAEHFTDRQDPARFNAQNEQRHASMNGTLPAVIADEVARLDKADLTILQYPMWWHLPPAILKGWLDRVFAYGEVYASKRRFENGRFTGKRAMLSVTLGTSAETYDFNGRSGDIDLLLWPVNFSLAYVGFTVLEPFAAYGVEAGIQYSDPGVIAARLEAIQANLAARLRNLDEVPAIPFNRMSDWGADGRIMPSARVFSPFIRHRRKLTLE